MCACVLRVCVRAAVGRDRAILEREHEEALLAVPPLHLPAHDRARRVLLRLDRPADEAVLPRGRRRPVGGGGALGVLLLLVRGDGGIVRRRLLLRVHVRLRAVRHGRARRVHGRLVAGGHHHGGAVRHRQGRAGRHHRLRHADGAHARRNGRLAVPVRIIAHARETPRAAAV